MPSWLKVDTNRPVGIIGSGHAAVVTNGATSGTLYIGGPTVSAGSNSFSIAAGASRPVIGPAWAIASTSVPVTTNEIDIPKLRPNAPTRWWVNGTASDDGAGADSQGGTATAFTAADVKVGQCDILERCLLTGIRVLAATPVSTDQLLVALYDYKGNPLAWSAIAGTAFPTANTYGSIAFTAPYEVVIPGKYFLGVAANGTTDKVQVMDATVGQIGDVSVVGGTVASAWTDGSAPTAITVPTTVGAVPVLCTY